ncbi:MAG: aminotransferase class I/II-fold pyridoxal phosphate-dependent enzyme [Emcibacteraceae bacterium]|nr:aminotransferase class I/II-fold pyridoxal phosphate-dependent enzyme [Emcibacteraceae bacterium]
MYKNSLSTLTKRISGPSSGAWEVGDIAAKRILAGEDIIHLGIGDPDLDTPQAIQDAVVEAIDHGKTHYAPLSGEYELRQAIADHGCGLYQGKVVAEDVVVCTGAQGALFATFLCLTEAGDEIIVLEPCYAPYPAVVTAGGGKMVSVVLDKEAGYLLDVDKIKAAVTDKTKAILINSPGNPSGAVFDQQALNELALFCYENSIWLISDEVYWSLCYEGKHNSAYKMEQYRECIIVVNSLSKSHAMTGWRIGWAIGPQHFIKAMTDLAQALHFGINQFVQRAAIVALNDRDTVKEFKEMFQSRRDVLCDGLRKSNHLEFSVPRGGMFVLIDITATGLSGKIFAEQLLEEEKIAVVPGFGFGQSVENTVRIGFLCDEERLKEAAKRIVDFAKRKVG